MLCFRFDIIVVDQNFCASNSAHRNGDRGHPCLMPDSNVNPPMICQHGLTLVTPAARRVQGKHPQLRQPKGHFLRELRRLNRQVAVSHCKAPDFQEQARHDAGFRAANTSSTLRGGRLGDGTSHQRREAASYLHV